MIALGATLAIAAGCTTDDYRRVDGVTGYAGNAVASNTVLQMVDPWPAGVEDTNIKTAAERVGEDAAAKQQSKKKVSAPSTTD